MKTSPGGGRVQARGDERRNDDKGGNDKQEQPMGAMMVSLGCVKARKNERRNDRGEHEQSLTRIVRFAVAEDDDSKLIVGESDLMLGAKVRKKITKKKTYSRYKLTSSLFLLHKL